MRHKWQWFVVLALAIACPTRAMPQEITSSEGVFDSDGVRIHYVVRGSGPPVVLLHGLAMNIGLNWDASGILDQLAAHHRVVALDMRGHGASDKPHDPAAYGANFTEDVVRLLDHLEIERAHVIGYSLGGAVTLDLVTRHPERVTSAVLGGAGWRPPEMGRSEVLGAWLVRLDRAARGEISVVAALFGPDSVSIPRGAAAIINANDPQALAAVIRGDSTFMQLSEQQVQAITTPMMAVVGEADKIARPEVERLAAAHSGMQVVILAGASHMNAQLHPLFVPAILRFLDSH